MKESVRAPFVDKENWSLLQGLAQSHRQRKLGVQTRYQRSLPCRNPPQLRDSRAVLPPPQHSPTGPRRSIAASDNQSRRPASASNSSRVYLFFPQPSRLPNSSGGLPKRQLFSPHFVSGEIV